jgi:hypothetical protein
MWCLWKARNDRRFNNLNWSVQRVLHEAKAIDGAYNIAFQDAITSQPMMDPTTTLSTTYVSQYTPLQVHDGPKFFCDASVDSQNRTGTQTGIGIFILTKPVRSLSYMSFFQVMITQALEL